MEVFTKILKLAEEANTQNDLPDSLFDTIRGIYLARDGFIHKKTEVETLLEMLEDYEPFADVGCGNESYGTTDIQRALKKILE